MKEIPNNPWLGLGVTLLRSLLAERGSESLRPLDVAPWRGISPLPMSPPTPSTWGAPMLGPPGLVTFETLMAPTYQSAYGQTLKALQQAAYTPNLPDAPRPFRPAFSARPDAVILPENTHVIQPPAPPQPLTPYEQTLRNFDERKRLDEAAQE
jgi:hypothetical protein